MLGYLIRRILTAIPTLFLIVTIAFFLMRIAPGGPFNQERGLNPMVKANLERLYRLDEPLWQQYLHYLGDLLQGNLGPSYNLPDFTVADLFRVGLPVSMELGSMALILALVVGGALGIIAALYQNKAGDYAVVALASAGSTVPNFVVAPLYQLVFALTLNLVPVAGWGGGAFVNKIGPVLTLALPQLAVVTRLMRGSMIEALLSDATIILKHALRGAVLPVVSYAGPAAASLLTGSIIVESIFAIPGIGRYFIEAALNRDYTLVMGTVVVIAVFIILFNLLVDLLYAALDPRVRYD